MAVYGLRDQTGQYKSYPDSSYSTLVTQGAATILVKSLEDSGWYLPVEREGLQNLLTERRIIRALESPTDKGAKPPASLPNLIPASLIVEGGVIAYESNVRTGGKGANYLGIGASNQYRVDQVTVILRTIDVRGGQVLNTVSVTKTIYSYQFSTNVYKYIAYQSLLQGEAGYTTNEPAQLAVREAIEAAVIHLTVQGIRDRYFELRDPGDWTHPVIQSYLAEGLTNFADADELEEGTVIPRRPLTQDRVGLAVPTLGGTADEGAGRSRVVRAVEPALEAPAAPTEAQPATRSATAPQRQESVAPPRGAPVSPPGGGAPAASTGGAVGVGPVQGAPRSSGASSTSSVPAASTGAPSTGDIFQQYWRSR